MNRALTIAFALAVLAPLAASADLTKCDGVWTNKPCKSASVPSMTESKPTPRPQKDIDAAQKRTLITELENRRLTLRDQYGVDVGVSPERSLCASPEISVADCARAVNEKEKYLDDRALAAANLKAAENQASSNSPADSGGNGQITIVQQSGDQYINGRPYFRRTPRPVVTDIPNVPEQPLPPPPPDDRPPPHRRVTRGVMESAN